STHPRQSALFGLGHTQALVGLADFLGDLFPRVDGAGLLVGSYVEEYLVEVELAEVRPPLGTALLLGDLERAQAELEHPLRFALHVADLLDDFLAQALTGLEEVVLCDLEVVLLGVLHALELGGVGMHVCLDDWIDLCSHQAPTASRTHS